MNERREIRLRVLELVGRDSSVHADNIIETVLSLERFIWDADVANVEEPADSAAPVTDNAGTA
ncbi:hypothetical protein MesoLj131c_62130 [Mesorhizobium sp. 131-3-5]|uniref:hypothetical protein n=1 Tax=Mesorhizobium sp. 131-3-5 TaxID=2744520 RepID=UPI00192723CA|nr:hypothetical protein [Mesorhizobium sp. 131-3-5]BCH11955.1 hypothetical protein MesoLj131c_62130 [Mesorhizobium sp. 131-3-5]